MRKRMLWGLLLVSLTLSPFALSQQKKKTAQPPPKTPQQQNIDQYIELLRSDVRQDKAEIMGAVMALSAADATKFWPIYSDYDTELTKLNNQRVQNIKDYAAAFDTLTPEKADELIKKAFEYQKQRGELLADYYGKVKDAVGAVEAARFVQVEHQLLLLIDLEIAAELPVAQQGTELAQGAKK